MPQQSSLAEQAQLVRALLAQMRRHDPGARLFETHISLVLVSAGFAYKFKKPLRFDFLDFSTLAARRYYCLEELRLNRRLAPDLYLDVVPVAGSAAAPQLERGGTAIDYAVKMRAFAQDDLWTARLERGVLGKDDIDGLAALIAGFHQRAEHAQAQEPWGSAEIARGIAEENFAGIAALLKDDAARITLAALRKHEEALRTRLEPVFLQRKEQGCVRECHGDLHAANILSENGKVQVFDCIEFNERMRRIDVIDDIAFVCMDLQWRGRPDLAARFLNGYLELSGDYGGLALLPYYFLQRALVRCKVALLRVRQAQGEAGGTDASEAEALSFLALARHGMRHRRPALMIMHGLSGSGKTCFSQAVVESEGAIRLRSDVERKRLHGLSAQVRAGPGLYSEGATQATYARLAMLARMVLAAGFAVVVDAAFLRRNQRITFAALADARGLPFLILDMQCDAALLHARLEQRARQGADASDAGSAELERQLGVQEPLSADELAQALRIGPDGHPAALERIAAFPAISPATTEVHDG